MRVRVIAGMISRFLVILLSFTTVIPFGRVTSQLGNNCILFSNPEFLAANGSAIVGIGTEWGPRSSCEYCTYSIIFGVIVSVITCWFILVFFRRDDFSSHKTCLNVPILFLEISLLGFTLAAALVRHLGFQSWCDALQDKLGWSHCNEHSVFLERDHEDDGNIFVQMHISVIANWCLCFLVFFQLLATIAICAKGNKTPDKKQGNNNFNGSLNKIENAHPGVEENKEDQIEMQTISESSAETVPCGGSNSHHDDGLTDETNTVF